MVFFTCNACGESLKKVQVEKHVNMCRGCKVLSCIDCGHDFWGDDYKDHNKCISEDQKYGGKGYEAKANKGDVKQQQWIQRVQEAMNKPGVSAKLKDVLKQVCAYDNVPRKKAKFQNWMKNSMKITNSDLQEEVWSIIIASSDTQQTKESEACTNGAEKPNGETKAEEKKIKLNKRERKEARQQKNRKANKRDEETDTQEPESNQIGKKRKNKRQRNQEDEEEDGNDAENGTPLKKAKLAATNDVPNSENTEDKVVAEGKFNWKGNIKSILRQSPDQELAVKKLRKRVVAAYYSFTGDSNFKTEQDVLALFNKKINNNPKFRILKDRVKLIA